MGNKFLQVIQQQLLINGTQQNKQNYERYFKYVIKFYGLKSDQVKNIFTNLYKEIKLFNIQDQIDLAFMLLSGEYAEEKAFAIKILEKLTKSHLNADFMDIFVKQIEKNVYDWATCDILSSKVNTNIILKDPKTIEKIIPRKNSKYMRVQRSVCVSFVRLGKSGNYNEEIISICSETIKNPERFVQLGTGWVLRELSLADLNLTENFIKNNYKYFSREGLRYAIEKMHPEKKKEILQYNK